MIPRRSVFCCSRRPQRRRDALGDRGAMRVRRWLPSVAVTIVVVAVLPSPAVASPSGTIGFSVGAEQPTEDHDTESVTFSVTVSGTTSVEATLRVKVASDGEKCPSPSELPELGADYDHVQGVAAGSFSYTWGESLGVGSHTLCGYLTQGDDRATGTFATGEDTFQVTPPPVVQTPSESPETAPKQELTEPILEAKPAAPVLPLPAPHLATLNVRVRSHAGSTAAKPGKTELLVDVTPDADLRLVLKRHGHTLTKRTSFGAHSSGKVIVPWSCSTPGGVYSYTITATDAYGAHLTRRGEFRPVSASRCRSLGETDARRHQEEEAAGHREAEREAREEHSPQYKIKVAEAEYCERVLNGNAEESFIAAGHIYTRCIVGFYQREVIVEESVVG